MSIRSRPGWLAGAFAAAVLCGGTGCVATTPHSENHGAPGVRVAVAIAPLAELVRRVGGQYVTVTNLTQPGVEPHDAELTGDQINEVLNADLVVFVGNGFQPAVEAVLPSRTGARVDVLSLAPTGRAADPHIWLDPVLFGKLGALIAEQLSLLDHDQAAAFARNAASWKTDMLALDRKYADGLSTCARRELVTVHAAFGYLAARYRLQQISVSGMSPDAEPSAERMATIAGIIEKLHITTVFTEELVSPKVAEALARETGTTTATLSPIESFTTAEIAGDVTYADKMHANLSALKTALDCS